MSECHKSNSDSVQTRENGEEGEGVLFAISIYSTDARFNTIGQDLREANSNVVTLDQYEQHETLATDKSIWHQGDSFN